MLVDAEELVGRTAASLIFLDIVPDLIPRHGERCMVGLPIHANDEEFRALFTASDDEPILRLLVFLRPDLSLSNVASVLERIAAANTRVAAGAFFLDEANGALTFYTSAFLGTDDPLPTDRMIATAQQQIATHLSEIRRGAQ